MAKGVEKINNQQINQFQQMKNSFASFPQFNTIKTTQIQKADTVEINNTKSKDNEKQKKIITYSSIAIGLVIATTALIKRKQIGEFFSNLFKKPKLNPIPDVQKPASGTGNIPIPPQKIEFPLPKFKDGGTAKEKEEYVNSILKYLQVSDKEAKIKAIETVGKYGTEEQLGELGFCLAKNDDDIIQATVKAFSNSKNPDNAFIIIEPISTSRSFKDETYIETLKAIQKLAHLENETEQDRKIILEPIQRLLTHKSEKVRNMAQETLDKIIIK